MSSQVLVNYCAHLQSYRCYSHIVSIVQFPWKCSCLFALAGDYTEKFRDELLVSEYHIDHPPFFYTVKCVSSFLFSYFSYFILSPTVHITLIIFCLQCKNLLWINIIYLYTYLLFKFSQKVSSVSELICFWDHLQSIEITWLEHIIWSIL